MTFQMTRWLGLIPVIAAGAQIVAASPVEASVFSGKLWVIGASAAHNATFPVPSQAPDATFKTTHLAFFSVAPCSVSSVCQAYPSVNNTIGTFLSSANGVSGLSFSGVSNPLVGAPVTADTTTVDSTSSMDSTRGIYVELTGRVYLYKNELITVVHDYGASLKIDGVAVTGLASGAPQTDFVVFSGASGFHQIDLVFANEAGPGMLVFSPAM